jgi:hypothetical protein
MSEKMPIPVAARSKGAHTRTSVASESGWAWVPMSQTRPCVECHEPESTRACVVIYIRACLPSQAPRGGLASQTRTCMGTLTFWHPNFFKFFLAHPVCKMWIIREPKKVALWNKRNFEEKEMESVQHV